MSITFGTPTTATGTSDTTSGNTITIARPPTAVDGDVLIMAVARKGASGAVMTSWGTLTGWTQFAHNDGVSDQQHYSMWWRAAPDVSALPADWTITASGGGSGQAIAGAIIPVHGASTVGSPIHVAATGALTGSNSPVNFAGLTTTENDAVYMCVTNIRWNTAVAPVGSLVELVDIAAAHGTTSNSATLFVGYRQQPTAGAVAAQSATWTGSQAWRSDSFALLAAGLVAVAGPDQTVEAGELVILDGSGSTNATTWNWSQTGGGLPVILDNTDTDTASFNAPRPTGAPSTVNIQLEVGDGVGTDIDTMVVTVNSPIQESLGLFVLDVTGNPV